MKIKNEFGHHGISRIDPERDGREFLGHAYSKDEAKAIISKDKERRKLLGLD